GCLRQRASLDPHKPGVAMRFPRRGLLARLAGRAAEAGAEVPTETGYVTFIRTAGTRRNARRPLVRIKDRELVLARGGEASRGVDDAGPYRGGNAGAADDVPVGVGIDPDPAGGAGVSRLPGELLLEGAVVRVPADAGAAGGDDVRRRGRPDHPGAVTGGGEVDDPRLRKIRVVERFPEKLATAPTHRNLAAARVRRAQQRVGLRESRE